MTKSIQITHITQLNNHNTSQTHNKTAHNKTYCVIIKL